MSSKRKRGFQIEGFKHRVTMGPEYGEKTWDILEQAIHDIYNYNTSDLSFEELYRFLYFSSFPLCVGKICVHGLLRYVVVAVVIIGFFLGFFLKDQIGT
jgi:hypothetical protein